MDKIINNTINMGSQQRISIFNVSYCHKLKKDKIINRF